MSSGVPGLPNGCRFVNLYGPTGATFVVASYILFFAAVIRYGKKYEHLWWRVRQFWSWSALSIFSHLENSTRSKGTGPAPDSSKHDRSQPPVLLLWDIQPCVFIQGLAITMEG
jgi:hypothetical protein